MEEHSCIDYTATTIGTESTSTATPQTAPFREKLCRTESGASVVLDIVNGVVLEAESRKLKLPSSRYKGVVPQPNGRWGAQIYEKHLRVWLGTFNDEDEAARSYDVAVRRFRGLDAVLNFKRRIGDAECAFLNAHSKAEIVDMLRKHTYEEELQQRNRRLASGGYDGERGDCGTDVLEGAREDLFEKSVTPSDVGKLNRLVIPKQKAEKHFPLPGRASAAKGVLLNFEDATGRVWRFRYSYWNSSQSYVLTKVWSPFVKERKLRAGDVVGFHRSTGPEKQLYINWKVRSEPVKNSVQMVRLFGVDIFEIPFGNANEVVGRCDDEKRARETDTSFSEFTKKQRIIDPL